MFLMCFALISVVGTGYYINHKFNVMNTVSALPVQVSFRALDDGATGSISTDPARQVLGFAQSGQTGQFLLNPNEDASGVLSDGADQRITLHPVQEAPNGTITILLMGVDARDGDAIDYGVRPDSLSVMRLDPVSQTCRMLAIPRDTLTELPGYGQTKINHALAVGGIPYETLVVEQLLGIDIDHYGLIDLSGTRKLVDAIDGVTVTNPEAFEIEGTRYAEGELHLDGDGALDYARYRYDDRGDFGRIDRQQQIIRALLDQTAGMDVVLGAPTLLTAVDGHIRTDLAPEQMVNLAMDFRSSCTSSTLETSSLDGQIESHRDPLLNMNLSYVVVDQHEIEAKVGWLQTGGVSNLRYVFDARSE